MLVMRENPLMQESNAEFENTSQASMNKIINQDLQFITVKMHNFHRFLPSHVAECIQFV